MVCELYLNTAVFLKTYTSQKVDEFSEDAKCGAPRILFLSSLF